MPDPLRVIVPVRDDRLGLERCLQALSVQSRPVAVTVVDDGSREPLDEVARSYGVQLIRQPNQGSYSARNLAVESTSESLIAFCDADCLPGQEWAAAGVEQLKDRCVALVAGRVAFSFSPRPSGAERFDAMTNMQIEAGVRQRRVAKTANLFVRRSVFDDVGPFPHVRSGGDVMWTRRAADAGHRIVYCPEAVVYHPARRLLPLLRKQIRVGRGQVRMPSSVGPSNLLSGLRPMPLARVRWMHRERGWPTGGVAVGRTWVAGLAALAATFAGRLVGFACRR